MTAMNVRMRLLLLAVILLAAGLRFWDIDQPYVDALAWRQASTAMLAESLASGEGSLLRPVVRWSASEAEGDDGVQAREFQLVPGLAALGYGVWGQAEWIGRAVTAAFGVWGVAAVFLLVRRVWGEWPALMGAAVLAVMPGPVYFDRCFSSDPAMAALATTALWLTAEAAARSARPRRWFWLAAAAAVWGLACLTKLQAIVVVVPAGYLLATCGWRWNARSIAGVVLCAALPIGVVVAYYAHVTGQAAVTGGHVAGGGKYVWDSDLSEWIAAGWYLPRVGAIFLKWVWTPPVIVLAVIGLVWRAPGTRPTRWLFHLWAAASVVLVLVESRHLSTDPQNMAILHPVAAALAGLGIVRVAEFLAGRWPRVSTIPRVGLPIGCVLVIAGIAVMSRATQEPWAEGRRELGLVVANQAAPDDRLISIGLDPVAIYYSGRWGWVFTPSQSTSKNAGGSEDWFAEIERLRAAGADWLVVPADQLAIDEAFARTAALRYEVVTSTQAGAVYKIDLK